MDIQIIIQNNTDGKVYDVSKLALKISWETTLSGQPGKLTFDLLPDPDTKINEGSPISLKVNGTGVFFGYIFKRQIKKDDITSITAYDQMRYLKNKDTYAPAVLSGMTASQRFEKLCKDFQLKYRVVNASNYVLADKLFDNKSLFEIMEACIDETLAFNGNWFVIRDNFGVLEFCNLNNLKTTLIIGDKSLLQEQDYESSIDNDTYNKIKIVQENEKSGKRDVYIVQDGANMKKWGNLQYFEKVDDNLNAAQIQQYAEMLLKAKNRITKKLKLTCIGDLKVFAGAGVILSIEDLQREGVPINQYFLVTSCTHTFENDLHTMKLEVQVSV